MHHGVMDSPPYFLLSQGPGHHLWPDFPIRRLSRGVLPSCGTDAHIVGVTIYVGFVTTNLRDQTPTRPRYKLRLETESELEMEIALPAQVAMVLDFLALLQI
jgi:hypothetical protein